MSEAEMIELAIQQATQCVPPKPSIPRVGCAIEVDGKSVMTSKRDVVEPQNHAERNALEGCRTKGIKVQGATVYTTLEPCTRQARREAGESCTERLIAARVGKVCIGMLDPNQEVCGRGVQELQRAGIEVTHFPHDKFREVSSLNEDFIRVHQTLGIEITDPAAGSHSTVKKGRHKIKGTLLNLPTDGELLVLLGNKDSLWWPQAQPFNFDKANGTWTVDVDLNTKGNFRVIIARANPLARSLVAYYEKVSKQRASGRKVLIKASPDANEKLLKDLADPDLTKTLGNDHLGISLTYPLPKGLDEQGGWLIYDVTD